MLNCNEKVNIYLPRQKHSHYHSVKSNKAISEKKLQLSGKESSYNFFFLGKWGGGVTKVEFAIKIRKLSDIVKQQMFS